MTPALIASSRVRYSFTETLSLAARSVKKKLISMVGDPACGLSSIARCKGVRSGRACLFTPAVLARACQNVKVGPSQKSRKAHHDITSQFSSTDPGRRCRAHAFRGVGSDAADGR